VTVEQRSGRWRARATSAGRAAGTTTQKAGAALVEAVGELADAAVDRVLLTEGRVTSAAEGRRRLAGASDTEALSDKVQRVVVLATPIVRVLARGARFTRLPWAMIASSSVSIGLTVRTGVREPRLVKKIAIDLYLDPKRVPDPTESQLRLVRLTRKWVLLGAFGRNTSTRAGRALDAADKLDAKDLAARWERS
jgi:hypothetical protein